MFFPVAVRAEAGVARVQAPALVRGLAVDTERALQQEKFSTNPPYNINGLPLQVVFQVDRPLPFLLALRASQK
jgi:hypothetical protein